MRCVVTGGCGFIGSHVIDELKKNGHEVTNIDKKGKDAIVVDICDTKALSKVLKEIKADVVFHLAAVADAREALADPVKAVNINIGGTASVLEACREASVKRFIFASTCWVASAMGSGIVDENTPFSPTGGGHVYTTTKIAGELLCHDFNKLYGLSFTILRYGIPYGPGMWSGLVLRNFLDNAFSGKPLVIFGDGSASRRFLYIEDLARAHVLALQEVAENQTYNLEGMRSVTIKELAELVSKLLGGVEIQYKEEPTRRGEFKYFRQIISSNKAHIELNWEPRIDLEEGVRRTIEWYKKEVVKSEKRKG
ncbi:MAG TPA: NAD-dependent epimerase/dehydratase family protein [Candidatus Desulfofervidus auxilii]|uniref:NAD-dependent epimerase/dehydratase family protein n=1 Tax=Desulfofervidus auxilii TaxID=1621989 RepID=A0A7V0I9J7_DESA2|nr:NAD-dependent epimerase/dehydratase family protein [Candidatus Desulfofervidus auxilii]